MVMMNGERAYRMYGFCRGEAQFLLDLTGNFEQVMRLGGWTVTSSLMLSFQKAMNGRGTLRSPLRSFRHDEVTQIVAQLASTNSRWTVGVVKGVGQRAMGETREVDHAVLVSIEEDNAKVRCNLLTECVLESRNGKEDEDEREKESVEEDFGEVGEPEGWGDGDETDSEWHKGLLFIDTVTTNCSMPTAACQLDSARERRPSQARRSAGAENTAINTVTASCPGEAEGLEPGHIPVLMEAVP